MRTSVLSTMALGLIAALSIGESARAVSLSSTSNAIPGFQGSQNYVANGALDDLDATVEFAVFAPGDFDSFLSVENDIDFSDPAPTEYIYAYQITEVVQASSGITIFTVGLNGHEATGAVTPTSIPLGTDYGAYVPAPTDDPLVSSGGPGLSPTSSQWSFFGSLGAGETSTILFYSSPVGPEYGFSQVTSATAAQQVSLSLPNPVPEPSAAVLAACCFALLSGRRVWLVR